MISKRNLSFIEWLEKYEDEVNDIFDTIVNTIYNEVEVYHPIESIYIKHEELYKRIAKYIYETSYNIDKKYGLRII